MAGKRTFRETLTDLGFLCPDNIMTVGNIQKQAKKHIEVKRLPDRVFEIIENLRKLNKKRIKL